MEKESGIVSAESRTWERNLDSNYTKLFFLKSIYVAKYSCCVLLIGLKSASCRHVVVSEEIGKESEVLSFG